jgi:hypothetical protein
MSSTTNRASDPTTTAAAVRASASGASGKPLIISGGSRGAYQAIQLAWRLYELGIVIDVLVLHDPVPAHPEPGFSFGNVGKSPGPNDTYALDPIYPHNPQRIPPNVKLVIHYKAGSEGRQALTSPKVILEDPESTNYVGILLDATHTTTVAKQSTDPVVKRYITLTTLNAIKTQTPESRIARQLPDIDVDELAEVAKIPYDRPWTQPTLARRSYNAAFNWFIPVPEEQRWVLTPAEKKRYKAQLLLESYGKTKGKPISRPERDPRSRFEEIS